MPQFGANRHKYCPKKLTHLKSKLGDLISVKSPPKDRIQAITFDAYGTLLYVNQPFQRLARELRKAGLDVPVESAKEAFLHEAAYYKEHHLEATDFESLRDLRNRCAEILFSRLAELGYAIQLPQDKKLKVLMDSIKFDIYEDVKPILAWCKKSMIATGVVSNWDCSLPQVLKGLLNDYSFQVVMVSAFEGIAKSDPAIYLKAAEALGLTPSAVLHVGNEKGDDYDSAGQAGFRALLLDREGRHSGEREQCIQTLSQLPTACRSFAGNG
jgi:putative hydrolase of the HAD superfamily